MRINKWERMGNNTETELETNKTDIYWTIQVIRSIPDELYYEVYEHYENGINPYKDEICDTPYEALQILKSFIREHIIKEDL